MTVAIQHNPDCAKSRNVLAIIRKPGTDPAVIQHQKTCWTRPQLVTLFAAVELAPRSALRVCKGACVAGHVCV